MHEKEREKMYVCVCIIENSGANRQFSRGAFRDVEEPRRGSRSRAQVQGAFTRDTRRYKRRQWEESSAREEQINRPEYPAARASSLEIFTKMTPRQMMGVEAVTIRCNLVLFHERKISFPPFPRSFDKKQRCARSVRFSAISREDHFAVPCDPVDLILRLFRRSYDHRDRVSWEMRWTNYRSRLGAG